MTVLTASAQGTSPYSETVLTHAVRPLNCRPMDRPDGFARITGSCGDTMEFYIGLEEGDRIAEITFQTDGCLTTCASASMTVQLATGRRLGDALGIGQQEILEALDGLPADSEHCALLAANTLRAAIVDAARMRPEPWKRLYRTFR